MKNKGPKGRTSDMPRITVFGYWVGFGRILGGKTGLDMDRKHESTNGIVAGAPDVV